MPALRQHACRRIAEIASARAVDGCKLNGTLYDVRTVLPADEVSNSDMLKQGRIASHVVASWFADPPDDDPVLAEQIPFLPRRADDYTMRSAVVSTNAPKTDPAPG